MRVIYKEPGKDPAVKEIENDLVSLQALVGGLIEPVRLRKGLVLIMNEEGKLNGMSPNFYLPALGDMIVGPVVFTGEDGENFADVPDMYIGVITQFFKEGWHEKIRRVME